MHSQVCPMCSSCSKTNLVVFTSPLLGNLIFALKHLCLLIVIKGVCMPLLPSYFFIIMSYVSMATLPTGYLVTRKLMLERTC